MNSKNDVSECIHCHVCQKHCEFLKKYGIDIGDTEKLKELSYHCFLCGKCTEVCPIGIDGRDYILKLRRENVREAEGIFREKGYGMLLKEKKDYIYKNYRNATGKCILFPGCNFPSFYPKTMKKLVKLLKEHGIGVAYDCCGKPIAELGLEADEKRIIQRINDEFEKRGVEEVIMLCPNCYTFLNPYLKVKVTDIYAKLEELGIGEKNLESGKVFLPCPDREKREILASAERFVKGSLESVKGVQCCGLGGCAPVKEPEIAKHMASALAGEKKVYSYCASCSGNLTRGGCQNVRHLLTEILTTYEKPDVKKSMINRAKTKFT